MGKSYATTMGTLVVPRALQRFATWEFSEFLKFLRTMVMNENEVVNHSSKWPSCYALMKQLVR